ncbi:MAG: metal ABC transporter ATP-binding protein [Actinobacteria bacterium]|nr:metal ABC transporter ATP-binding protein [Actinomycetota bacterium]
MSGPGELLRAQALSFGYGAEPILRDVDLSIDPKEFVALVGPNGSGKSTLLKILLGLLKPDSGSVELFGVEPSRFRERWRLGYVPQRPSLGRELPATVQEVVSMGRLSRVGWRARQRPADRREIEHALDSVALFELRSRPINELSVGQQQRAFIARAFASSPELLVLDEPIAGVDTESQQRFRDSLAHLRREHGSAVLLVSHELGAVAEDLDRVIVLKGAVVFDGSPKELVAQGVSLGIHGEDLPLWLERLG